MLPFQPPPGYSGEEGDEGEFAAREAKMESLVEDGGVKKRILMSGLQQKVSSMSD